MALKKTELLNTFKQGKQEQVKSMQMNLEVI